MSKYVLLLALSFALGFASNLDAEVQIFPKVDEAAPALGDCKWALNAPASNDLEKLKGEVVLILSWNWQEDDSLAYLISMQSYYEKNKDKGLHLFAFHSAMPSADEAKHEDICDKAIEYGITYPIASAGGESYTARFLPNIWVIGTDGKIKFADHPRKFNGTTTLELKKVLFPGLGTNDVAKKAVKAAELYGDGKLSKAREEAKEILEDDKDDAQAVGAANHILALIDKRYQAALAKIKAAVEEGNYLKEQRLQEWIAEAFDGDKEADASELRLDEMKDDDAIKDEIKASEDLEKLMAKLIKKKKNSADTNEELAKFCEDEDLADSFTLKLATAAQESDSARDAIRMALNP